MVVAELAVRLNFKPPTILLTGSSGLRHTMPFANLAFSKPVDVVALLRAITDLRGQAVMLTAPRP